MQAERAAAGCPGKAGNCGRHTYHLAELRSGDPAACTLLSGGIFGWAGNPSLDGASGPPRRSPVALDPMTAMLTRELTWGDPIHPPPLRSWAKPAPLYCGRQIQARISAPTRR